MNFLNENSHKSDLKCQPPRLSDEKKFCSKLKKAVINSIFLFPFYLLRLLLKRIVLKNCVKSNYVEFWIHT